MTTIGTATAKILVQPGTRTLECSGLVNLNESVTVTLHGYGSVDDSSLALEIYRAATQVAACVSFTQAEGAIVATGTLDLDDADLVTVFDGVPTGTVLDFDAFVWDTTTGELLGQGTIQIRGQNEAYST